MGTLALTKSSCFEVEPANSYESDFDLQAVESLQELSNVSSDNIYPSHMSPPGLKILKHSLLSSASQTLSPRTPTQSNSSDNKRCVNCQCTSTPLWRKDKGSGLMYCNACGIYLKNHGKPRPLELIEGIGLSKIVNTPPGSRLDSTASDETMDQQYRASFSACEGEQMDWEEQRLELIEGLLARPSPSQPSLQEAVTLLLYMAQDDTSSSGGDSPQADDAEEQEGAAASGRRLRRRARKAVAGVRAKQMKKPGAASSKQGTACGNCHTTYTPLWRKDCNTGEILCNACGIYLKTHGKPRALEGMMAGSHRALVEEQPLGRASPNSNLNSTSNSRRPGAEGIGHNGSPRSFRDQSAQTHLCTDAMPDGVVHRVHITPSKAMYSHHQHQHQQQHQQQRRSNIKSSPSAYGIQPAAVRQPYTPAQFCRVKQPKLFKDAAAADSVQIPAAARSGSAELRGAGYRGSESGSPSSLASHGSTSHVVGSERMTASQVPGLMSGQGLNPHAAAALQFWLSQGALNPHAHSSYFPSLPYGDPLRHHFTGLAAAFAAQQLPQSGE